MKKTVLLCTLACVAIIFSGCSSRYGVQRLAHNGKAYYFDREACPRFYYKNGEDEIQCANSDGVKNGISLWPMSQQDYQNYLYERQVQAAESANTLKAINNFNQNLQMQNMNNNLNMMNMQMMRTPTPQILPKKGWYN